MSELTDLEICRRIADIENIHYMETRYKGNANFLALVSDNDFTGTPPEMIGKYDPLNDDALCFKLMVKYKVSTCFIRPSGSFIGQGEEFTFRGKPNRAILLAIIESHND